mgnify:CR=1 FL=1
MYLLPKEITGYEIEITSNCNARCPDCSRTRLLEKNQLIINEINTVSYTHLTLPTNREV